MIHDDADILRMLKSGERDGMKFLLRRYYRSLVLFVDGFMHNLSESEDIVQEQFIKLWENRLFDGIHAKALSTYLFTISRNACFNILEHRGIQTERISPSHLDIAFHEAERLDERTVQLVREALNKLPQRMREIVYSVVCENYSYAETAERFGISINTVKTSLRKGMKQLRDDLGDRKDLLVVLFLLGNFSFD